MRLTLFLFHLETCFSFAFAVVSVIIFVIGFRRTRLWAFVLLAVGTIGYIVQLALHYYYFLRGYDLSAELKITGTVLFFLNSSLSLIGAAALAFGLPRWRKASNQALQPTATRFVNLAIPD